MYNEINAGKYLASVRHVSHYVLLSLLGKRVLKAHGHGVAGTKGNK